MNKTIMELKSEALKALEGNWGTSIGVFLVLYLITSAAGFVSLIPLIGWVAIVFLSGVVMGGMFIYCLNLLKGNAVFEDGFKGFNDFVRFGGSYFMVSLFTMLWSLLFLIPGIIKTFSYSMTLYIVAEDPNIEIMDAITKSREIMDGHKFRLFVLQLSFIGWGILCLFTLGIGYLWLAPYMQTTITAFYNDIKPQVTLAQDMLPIVEEI